MPIGLDEAVILRVRHRRIAMHIVHLIGTRVIVMLRMTIADAAEMIVTMIDTARNNGIVARNENVAIAKEALSGKCLQNAGRYARFLVTWSRCRSSC